MAANTRRLYRAALGRWRSWLEAQGLAPGDETTALYLTSRAIEGLSPATLRLDAAAIRWAAKHLAGGAPWVEAAAARTLKGLAREHAGRGRGQVAAIRWPDADRMAAFAAGSGRVTGVRDAALIRVMSDALLRISECAALDVGDVIALGAAGDGAELRITRSKTDQQGRGASAFLGPPTVESLDKWREVGRVADGPLFRRGRTVRGGEWMPSRSPLHPNSIRAIIQRWAKLAGIKGRVSGHSLRVGAAQSLAAAGAGLVAMQQAGRWKSPDMPAHYASGQLASRGAVARLRYNVGGR